MWRTPGGQYRDQFVVKFTRYLDIICIGVETIQCMTFQRTSNDNATIIVVCDRRADEFKCSNWQILLSVIFKKSHCVIYRGSLGNLNTLRRAVGISNVMST